MAFHRTIVARTGFVDEMVAYLTRSDGRNALISHSSGEWLGAVADDETGVIEAATEYFGTVSRDSVVARDSVEAWDLTDETGETLIGWSITADGWSIEDDWFMGDN
jgi:hypothetical protein